MDELEEKLVPQPTSPWKKASMARQVHVRMSYQTSRMYLKSQNTQNSIDIASESKYEKHI